MAEINELKVRNTTKKNIQRGSNRAKQYDFLVKKGTGQDEIGFMSILDAPIESPLTGNKVTLSEFLTEVAQESIKLQGEVQGMRGELNKNITEVEKIEARITALELFTIE